MPRQHKKRAVFLFCVSSCLANWSHAQSVEQAFTPPPSSVVQSTSDDLDADDNLLTTPNNNEDIPIEQIRHFIEVYQLVKTNYVESLTNDQLFEQALHGLVENLDPYSQYLDQAHYQQLLQFTEGEMALPDLNLREDKNQQWLLENLTHNNLNYKQGLRNGMILERINGQNVRGLSQRILNNLLSGSQGSTLMLRFNDGQRSKSFEVQRTKKINYDVEAYLTKDHMLILKLKAFQQDTSKQVQNLIQSYQQKTTLRGLIFDIRDNPGGLLASAVDLADMFLEKGLIVATKGRIEPEQRFQAFPKQKPIKYPIAILQNQYSASAAEVFSAALKEHHRAWVFGERSYGKGVIQKLIPINDGAIKLTVARYYTPDGHVIEGKGILPDVSLDMQVSEQQILAEALTTMNQYMQDKSKALAVDQLQ